MLKYIPSLFDLIIRNRQCRSDYMFPAVLVTCQNCNQRIMMVKCCDDKNWPAHEFMYLERKTAVIPRTAIVFDFTGDRICIPSWFRC